LEIINLWDSRAVSRAVIAPILQGIAGLSSSFSIFIIQHVIRLSNTIAHICAKHACTLELTSVWMEHPPSFLVASLQADSGGASLLPVFRLTAEEQLFQFNKALSFPAKKKQGTKKRMTNR
jgi:hypothetical protein